MAKSCKPSNVLALQAVLPACLCLNRVSQYEASDPTKDVTDSMSILCRKPSLLTLGLTKITKTQDLVPMVIDPFGQAAMSAMAMGSFDAGICSSTGSASKGTKPVTDFCSAYLHLALLSPAWFQ